MNKGLLAIFDLLLCGMFLLGCTKEKGESEKTLLPPASCVELVKAYQAGSVFVSAGESGQGCIIRFEDGSLVIPGTDFKVHDCTETAPAAVETFGEWWSVAGVVYGIKINKKLSDVEALPVYVYFDSHTLHVHLSNGSMLDFKSAEPAPEPQKPGNIPVVRIETEGAAPILDKSTYVRGRIVIEDADGLYTDGSVFSADMGIRGRGNSTWSWRKKPWKVKLDAKASVLGMPADREWCLLANYSDRTLLRNTVAMRLSQICGLSWTPRMHSVEVYLNGAYQGVYDLCEHKKVSSSRVNVDIVKEGDNEGDALSGGYYLEMEQNQDEAVCWWTSMRVPMMFIEPELPGTRQEEYVKSYINDFENALRSKDFASAREYIDVQSFIHYYIVQELTKNIDGNLRKSSFLTKERNKPMEMYHVWDFDLTMGNCGYFPWQVGNGPQNFWIKDYSSVDTYGDGWFSYLFQDRVFVKALQNRWNALMPELETIPDFIDRQVELLGDARKRNFEKWSITYKDPDLAWVLSDPKGSYEAEIEFLKDFYSKRLEWLDKELNRL